MKNDKIVVDGKPYFSVEAINKMVKAAVNFWIDSETNAEKPAMKVVRRKRRTKAEMEAARLAEKTAKKALATAGASANGKEEK